MLADRSAELRDRYGIAFRVTGIASRRLGWIADPTGIDLEKYGAGTPVRGFLCGAGALARAFLSFRNSTLSANSAARLRALSG